MTHCEETQWVASSFSNFFLRNNYAKLDPVEITSHIDKTVHTAVASGRWCGVQWPQCGLSGHHESAH